VADRRVSGIKKASSVCQPTRLFTVHLPLELFSFFIEIHPPFPQRNASHCKRIFSKGCKTFFEEMVVSGFCCVWFSSCHPIIRGIHAAAVHCNFSLPELFLITLLTCRNSIVNFGRMRPLLGGLYFDLFLHHMDFLAAR
jgi:hypothetical protein